VIALLYFLPKLSLEKKEGSMKEKSKDRRFGEHFVDYHPCSLSPRKTKGARIRCLNWIDELYGVPDRELEKRSTRDRSDRSVAPEADEWINLEVRKAVARLQPDEKRFVELFYFEFRSYQEISRKLRKRIHWLERIHNRALGKLRLLLADFVKERFGLDVPEDTDCVICRSLHRQELDRLIRLKKKEETYSRLIRVFKQRYGVDVTTPQVIIGHKKKHMV
jgi:RNA polymerase sigma factor (sigma-70 family)